MAVITGANGGMGRACARLLGVNHDLVLSDASTGLELFVRDLELEGYRIREAVVGDFRSADVVDTLASHASGGFAALVHMAGLPPSAEWRDIIEVNFVATARLLERISPYVDHRSVAVLIASVAGHLAPDIADVDAVLSTPFSPSLHADLEPLLLRELGPVADRAIGTLAYAISKKKVMELCEAYAGAWGGRGGRIVSISPGMIFTPMGRHEASLDEAAEAQVHSAPAGRWGTAAEIAAAVGFLLSPAAGFITGTDLRVDGGALGAFRSLGGPSWIELLKQRMAEAGG